MHSQPLEFFRRIRSAGLAPHTGTVAEAGALDMNGSAMNDTFTDAASHVGVDWRAGKGVSVVSVFHEWETDERFNTVLSTEMLEHDPHWRLSLAKMVEVLKDGGNLWLSCAARARPVHEKHVGINQHYEGLDLIDILPELRKLASFERIVCAQNVSPADTYIVALGKKPADNSPFGSISVVIPTCQSRYVGRCVMTHQTMATSVTRPEYIVVSNGAERAAEDAMLGATAWVPDVLAFYDVNLGYPGACNVGIQVRHPKAVAVALVNDDTEQLVYRWDERILRILSDKPEIGALSPVTNWIWNKTQKLGVVPTPELFTVPVLYFTWVAIPVQAIEAVGLLDERFGLGNYEDVDYSLRLADSGFRLVVDPVHVVYHRGHGTFSALPQGQFSAVMRANELLLRTKWRGRLD